MTLISTLTGYLFIYFWGGGGGGGDINVVLLLYSSGARDIILYSKTSVSDLVYIVPYQYKKSRQILLFSASGMVVVKTSI